ncbi:MAG: response regulator [Synergistales bacterium]|nr:response regulator [Synergistales bacterium]
MTYRILIVDDEAEIREMLGRHFRMKGYEVTPASGGAEALQCLDKKRYEVVVSDIVMPGMKGTELLQEIRQQYPMSHVIMITGYVTLENALAAMRRGADTCIFKPFEDFEELDGAVEKAIEDLEHWKRKLVQLQGMKPGQGGSEHDRIVE